VNCCNEYEKSGLSPDKPEFLKGVGASGPRIWENRFAKVVYLRVRGSPTQTECSADLFGFAPVEGRAVMAAFDGGRMTSDAGALLLGATDRAIRPVDAPRHDPVLAASPLLRGGHLADPEEKLLKSLVKEMANMCL
jgi:hypothetical protein